MRELEKEINLNRVVGIGLSGSGGERIAQQLGGRHSNELVAQTRALSTYHPEARSMIEIGGQDSKYLDLEWDDSQGQLTIRDFAMNAVCAAGTGSFLDQQAERLGIAIDEEFGELALKSETPARIAGRCTVFAKSDMIHLQQRGTPMSDIVAGLCFALARNFKGVISKGKPFTPPVALQGGVACNRGVVRAFEPVLQLKPGELIIPKRHELMAAIGAALLVADRAGEEAPSPFRGYEVLEVLVHDEESNQRPLPVLSSCEFALPNYDTNLTVPLVPLRVGPRGRSSGKNGRNGKKTPNAGVTRVYLGIDVGSISTNLVLIDEAHQVVARRYLSTAGPPLEAVRRGLLEIQGEVGDRVKAIGFGTTGSGRYLASEFVGGDVVRNEITAQVRAATAIDPEVDTIFEIGGQDSKYIRVSHGAVVDFTMNNACAAGTGSFLEEQAERLNLDVTSEFSELALKAARPTGLGERCTVFMESDVIHQQQQGAGLDQLAAGLAYAIAENWLHRVVNSRPIGKKIFFQGGVAWNQSVVAAFQTLLKRPVIVPPNHDVTGAVGVAILAQEDLEGRRRAGEKVDTRFKGFDLSDRQYETNTFECKACPNLCEVSKITITGDRPIFYGARCDRYEEQGRRQERARQLEWIPDLFAERSALLLGNYEPPTGPRHGRPRVGLPRALTTHDFVPYWRTLFEALGVELQQSTRPYEVISGASDAAYQQRLARAVTATETGSIDKIAEALAGSGTLFDAIPQDRSRLRPRIILIGEYFLYNVYLNLNLVRQMEAMGGEVEVNRYYKLFYAITLGKMERAFNLANTAGLEEITASDSRQRALERRMVEPPKRLFKHRQPYAASADDMSKYLRPHYNPEISNGAIDWGEGLELVDRDKGHGVIQIVPFLCLGAIVSASMVTRVRHDVGGVPWLDMVFDAQGTTNIRTRLEAFMHQAAQFQRSSARRRSTLVRNVAAITA